MFECFSLLWKDLSLKKKKEKKRLKLLAGRLTRCFHWIFKAPKDYESQYCTFYAKDPKQQYWPFQEEIHVPVTGLWQLLRKHRCHAKITGLLWPIVPTGVLYLNNSPQQPQGRLTLPDLAKCAITSSSFFSDAPLFPILQVLQAVLASASWSVISRLFSLTFIC